MRVLLDTCVWGKTKEALQSAGHDVIWTGDWPQDPGDEEILAYAWRESRVLATLDKDFGELVVVHEMPHKGIIRLVNISARMQATAILTVLSRFSAQLEAGAIVTVEPGRVRVRSAGT